MTSFTAMWLAYLGFAAIGFYCYCCIPTGLSKSGYGQAIYRAFGLALLFTPVPINENAITLAPAFVTIPFTIVQTGLSSSSYTLPWLFSAFLLALIITISTRSLWRESKDKIVSQQVSKQDDSHLHQVVNETAPESAPLSNFVKPASLPAKKRKKNSRERLDPTF